MTLRLGVLGAARISPPALFEPAQALDGVEVVAIAARDRARAQAQADAYGIGRVHERYEDLVDDPDIDAVYIPLPVSSHHPWTIRSLQAGKHVLCEKPFACNADQAAEMVRTAQETGRHLVEAFHWRYHPLAQRLAEVTTEIGPLRSIDAGFTAPIDPGDDVRHSFDLGGGALMDLGCYAVQWVRFVAGVQPRVRWVEMVEGRAGVDLTTRVGLAAGEVTAVVTTSMASDATAAAWISAHGEAGSFTARNPLAPHLGHELRVATARGERVETVDGATTYHHQLEAFRDLITRGTPVPTGGVDAVATMELIDRIYLAAGYRRRGC